LLVTFCGLAHVAGFSTQNVSNHLQSYKIF
jgi:hypothetical protein